jgi:hypothetical protein
LEELLNKQVIKVKGKVVPDHSMKVYTWHYMEVSGKLHGTAASTPDKERRYALKWMLGEPQSRFGRFREGKYLLCVP